MNQRKTVRCIKDTYEINEQVGRGNYGIVYKARRLSDNNIFAIKMPVDKDLNNTIYSTQQKSKAVSKILGEINFLKKIGDQAAKFHIIPLIDWYEGSDQNDPIMVMPFCESNLSVYCRENGRSYPFTCNEFLSLIEQILIALDYINKIHTNSIHRDVKIDNLLISNKSVYLCDFGTYKQLKRIGTGSLAGTIEWGAPEQFIPQEIELGSPYYRLTDKADIYPVGLIMFMMITFRGNYPKAQSKIETLIDAGGRCLPNAPEHFQKIGGLEPHEKHMCINYLTELANHETLRFPEEFIKGCINFLEQLLCPVIDQRLDASSALSQIRILKSLIHPKIVGLNVISSSHSFPIESPIIFVIDVQGAGLPNMNKWLSIRVTELNHEILLQSIHFVDNNQWKIVTNGINKEGQYSLEILTFDPDRNTSFQVQVYKPSEVLWKEKNYKDALLDYHHSDYPKWLKQIKIESKKSKNKLQEWISILRHVKEKVSIENKPELHMLFDELERNIEEVIKKELRKKRQKEKKDKVFHNLKKSSNAFIKICFAVLFIIVCIISYNHTAKNKPSKFDRTFFGSNTKENTEQKAIDDRTSNSLEFSNLFHYLFNILSEFEILNYVIDSFRKSGTVKTTNTKESIPKSTLIETRPKKHPTKANEDLTIEMELLLKKLAPKPFKYSPQGKIDPFFPLIVIKKKKTTPVKSDNVQKVIRKKRTRILQLLEKFDLSQLKLVAVMITPKSKIAIIEEPSGRGFVIKLGTKIGLSSSKVTDIQSDRIVVQEETDTGKVEKILYLDIKE